MKKYIAIAIIFIGANGIAQVRGVDLVDFVSAEQLPAPIPKSETERIQKSIRLTASDGFSTVENSPEAVNGFFRNMTMAKGLVASSPAGSADQTEGMRALAPRKDLSQIKLTFKPASFSRGKLIAAVPSGTLVGKAWTGVERFFVIDGAGEMRLTEFDMAASKGRFYMLKDAINSRVNGKSAISKIILDDKGRAIEEILWVNENRLSILTFGPDVAKDGKTKLSSHIGAHSISQELR
jgi:hypothetical protein